MNIAIVSNHDKNYEALAKLTWSENKLKYAMKHGYGHLVFFHQHNGKDSNHHFFGFNKIQDILNVLETDCYDWVFFSECDAMITNFNIQLEDLVDDKYHAIVSSCFNKINSGNLFVRNSKEGREFLQFILHQAEDYKNVDWAEQQVILDNLDRFKKIMKIVPQAAFNSYPKELYGLNDRADTKDVLGYRGAWEPGDFQVHWPGYTLERRLELAKEFGEKVVGK